MQQEHHDMEVQVKSLKEKQLNLETEKRCLEIELRRK